MTDQRINLKNPTLAGVLAFLLPGAGHLYQGRMFKAGVYAICILGLFFSGMAMADWKAVQPPPKQGKRFGAMLKYAAQLGVGTPSMVCLVQQGRYEAQLEQNDRELAPLTAPFTGSIEYRGDSSVFEENIEGTVHLEPVADRFGDTTYEGRLEAVIQGEKQEFPLGNHIQLGKEIQSSRDRTLNAAILRSPETPLEKIGQIEGTIPRPFLNWFQVPMDEKEVQELHGKLGKYHELAMVCTWIAGLLNILAIWDAVEGPAYGFGNEDLESEDKKPTSETQPA